MNAFQKYPHFIDSDIRVSRVPPFGYNVNYDLMKERHAALLPRELVAGKSVLDLGCCVAATGAWVLDLGAKSYTGVELQKNFATQAKENLSKSFSNYNWQIVESSIENFFKLNVEKYDIVYAGGILYSSLYYQELLKNIARLANIAVVIESKTPAIIDTNRLENSSTEFWPVVEYSHSGNMLHEDKNVVKIRSALPSIGAVCFLLTDLGFEIDFNSYNQLNNSSVNLGRYGGVFYKTSRTEQQTTENLYNNTSAKMTPWVTPIPTTWEFNDDIAKTFVYHAKKHIPDYNKVIDLAVLLCKTILKDPLNNKIIEVGCASGETITRLYTNGCCNLIGVDNSQAMLNQCPPGYAHYALDNKFPIEHGPYHAIICNWTLHFIKEKVEYLKNMYNSLLPGGFVMLTDKTENSGVALELYHKFKKKNGVSDEEIAAKALSVKNVMFIDNVEWYFRTLADIGFDDISIISSAPCFTTFIAFKH